METRTNVPSSTSTSPKTGNSKNVFRPKVIQFGVKKTPRTETRTSTEQVQESIINSLPTLNLSGIQTELGKLNMNQKETDLNTSNKMYNLPERIVGTYTDDFNILEAHDCILKHFTLGKTGRCQKLEEKILEEKAKIQQPQTMIERKRSLKTLDELSKQLEIIKGDVSLKKYLEEAETYISDYRELGPKPKIIKFRGTGPKEPTLDAQDDKTLKSYRLLLISRYLDIARKYIPCDVQRQVPPENCCSSCGENLDLAQIDEAGTLHCSCGVLKDTISKTPAYKDTARITTSSRNGYEDKENFIKAYMRFQGKQNNRFQKSLLQELDAYFRNFGMPTGEEIKKRPLDERGRRQGTNRSMMYKALQETQNAALYEDINLLLYLYWGWTLPDISHLETRILEDYERSQRVYEEIKSERSSCLNTQYRLFKHLQLLGYPCKQEDFKIVGTRDIQEYHENMWEKICKELGWPFIKTF